VHKKRENGAAGRKLRCKAKKNSSTAVIWIPHVESNIIIERVKAN
jgi:hypothetical protein